MQGAGRGKRGVFEPPVHSLHLGHAPFEAAYLLAQAAQLLRYDVQVGQDLEMIRCGSTLVNTFEQAVQSMSSSWL